MQTTLTEEQTEAAFFRAAEAAKAIPLPLRTFNLFVAKGMIPSYKFGRGRFFKKSEIIHAVEIHRVATKDEILS